MSTNPGLLYWLKQENHIINALMWLTVHRSALAARYIDTLGGVRVLCGQQGVRAPVAAAVAGSRLDLEFRLTSSLT
jgi:hypothetical protein